MRNSISTSHLPSALNSCQWCIIITVESLLLRQLNDGNLPHHSHHPLTCQVIIYMFLSGYSLKIFMQMALGIENVNQVKCSRFHLAPWCGSPNLASHKPGVDGSLPNSGPRFNARSKCRRFHSSLNFYRTEISQTIYILAISLGYMESYGLICPFQFQWLHYNIELKACILSSIGNSYRIPRGKLTTLNITEDASLLKIGKCYIIYRVTM